MESNAIKGTVSCTTRYSICPGSFNHGIGVTCGPWTILVAFRPNPPDRDGNISINLP